MLENQYNPCGDVNCDAVLDSLDVFIIQDFILGLGDIEFCASCFDEIVITVETCGCTDPEACNYCPACTMDDDSCWYAEDCSQTLLQELIKILNILTH